MFEIVPLGLPSSPWTKIVDLLFLFGISTFFAWLYYSYMRKDLLGKFWGATMVAAVGALIVFAILQNVIREIIVWLMSPKIGSVPLSNVNLIAISLGAYLALYIMNRINHNKERRD